jgi:hypothetical protein
MRGFTVNLSKSILLVTMVVGSLAACSPRPEKAQPASQITLANPSDPTAITENEKFNTDATAIWMTTSNLSNGGTLARLDLKSGNLNPQILTAPRDAVLNAGPSGVFMLTRMENDGVTVLSGPGAQATAHASLSDFCNPQSAARDSLGQVWVVSLDSNWVQVFSRDLKKIVASVDLTQLAVASPGVNYASLANVIALDADTVAVTAQRHHRSASAWQPDVQGGLALIDIHTYLPRSVGFTAASNPITLFAKNATLFILGAGDQTPQAGTQASLRQLSGARSSENTIAVYPFTVLDANLYSAQEPPALIAWYKDQNKSCVQIGVTQIYCEEGGYVFNHLLRVGNILYVAYSNAGNAGLWTIRIDNHEIQKFPMNLPIQSMTFGP